MSMLASGSGTPGPIRFGMIGCGALGVVHAQRLTAIPGVTVGSVSDPDGGAMDRTATVSNNPPGSSGIGRYADYKELLKHGELDAVCISSPNPWHVEQILASLERGLDVLCEKPLSMEPAEVRRVADATAASGKKVMIAYQSRYRRDSRILRRAIQSGKWGKVTSVSIFTCEDWITPNVGTWRHDPALPGRHVCGRERAPTRPALLAHGSQTRLGSSHHRRNRGTPVPMVTWGEARLSPSDGSPQSPIPFVFMFAGHALAIGVKEIRNTDRGRRLSCTRYAAYLE